MLAWTFSYCIKQSRLATQGGPVLAVTQALTWSRVSPQNARILSDGAQMNCALDNTGDLPGSKGQENREVVNIMRGRGADGCASRAGESELGMGNTGVSESASSVGV